MIPRIHGECRWPFTCDPDCPDCPLWEKRFGENLETYLAEKGRKR